MHPFPQAQSNQAVTGVADSTTATAESRAVVAPARSRPRDQAPRSQGPGGTAAAATVTLGGLRAPAMRADLKAHGPGPGGEEVQAHLVPRGGASRRPVLLTPDARADLVDWWERGAPPSQCRSHSYGKTV